MRHRASRKFWQFYRRLPETIRHIADDNYIVLKQDPKHPSLRFKKVGRFWSVRVGIHYRAVAVEDGSDPHSPEPTPAELERLQMLRQSIAEELPDLMARDQLRKEARDERSISGALRDAIHRSDVPLAAIATQAGLTPIQLDEFLTSPFAIPLNGTEESLPAGPPMA